MRGAPSRATRTAAPTAACSRSDQRSRLRIARSIRSRVLWGTDAPVRNLAMEFGPAGVRVNAICPGLVKTDFAKALWENPETEKFYLRQVPLRRLGEPEDFSGIAAFLASDAGRYITGRALTVDGGSVMWT